MQPTLGDDVDDDVGGGCKCRSDGFASLDLGVNVLLTVRVVASRINSDDLSHRATPFLVFLSC